jgi:hypothetical protein
MWRHRYAFTPRLLGQPSEWNCDRKVFQLFESTVATRGCGSASGGFTGWWDCWSEILGIHVFTGIGRIYGGPTCNPLATGLSLIGESMSREHWWNASDRGETKLLEEKTCTTVTLSTTSLTRIRPNAAKTGEGDNRRPIYLSRTQLYSVANWITNGCVWLAVCRSLVISFSSTAVSNWHKHREFNPPSIPSRIGVNYNIWYVDDNCQNHISINRPSYSLPLMPRQILTDKQQIPSLPHSFSPSPFSYNERDQSSHRRSAFCSKCQYAVTTLTNQKTRIQNAQAAFILRP